MSENAAMTDLIARLRVGDAQAAAEFVRHYEPAIRLRIRVCAFVPAASWLPSGHPAALSFATGRPDRSVFITSIVRQMAGHGSPASTFFHQRP